MGGEHAEGLTANAFLYFQDRSFIELISFIKPAKVRLLMRSGLAYLLMANGPKHVRYRFGQAAGFVPGLIDAALLEEELEDLSADMTSAGIKHIAPQNFARATPDGVQLTWRILCPLDSALPFIRDDYRPNLAIPAQELNHPNGVTGVHMLHYAVDDLAKAANCWNGMGEQVVWRSAAEFALDGIPITYHATSANPLWRQWVASTRAKPVRLDLLADNESRVGVLKMPPHWHCEINIVTR